jgi:hypothetical protein
LPVLGSMTDLMSSEQQHRGTCILVLGMHRSGTSAITRAISLMGAALPSDVLGSNAFNEAGHWEPIGILRANERFMRLLGHEWDDLRRLPLETCSVSAATDFIREIEALLISGYGDALTIVVKDPRVSLLKPLVSRAASNVGFTTVSVIATRRVDAVAKSLTRRDGMSRGYAELLWLRHTLDAEFLSRNGPRIVVPFERLLDDPDAVLGRLSKYLLAVGVPLNSSLSAAKASLRPELRHHRADATTPEISNPLVAECGRAIDLLVVDPQNLTAMQVLDDVRREFDSDATLMLDALYHEVAARRSRPAALDGSGVSEQ